LPIKLFDALSIPSLVCTFECLGQWSCWEIVRESNKSFLIWHMVIRATTTCDISYILHYQTSKDLLLNATRYSKRFEEEELQFKNLSNILSNRRNLLGMDASQRCSLSRIWSLDWMHGHYIYWRNDYRC
jgi:hypothetical protein